MCGQVSLTDGIQQMSDVRVQRQARNDRGWDDDADRLLMKRISEDRDRAAMEQLYREYRPRLVGFLRRFTRDDAIIEEAYNDVMMKVWEKGHQYRGTAKVSSWIFSVAYRICLRIIKKQPQFLEEVDDMSEDSATSSLAQYTEDRDLIERALRTLSPKHRLVVELCYFEGRSTEEIGTIVGCPANTVKTRLHHARNKLRSFVERAENSPAAASPAGKLF